MELKEKTALITGASKGIGLSTAKALLEKGTTVVGWSRSKPDLDHPNFYFFQTDVSKYEEVIRSYNELVRSVGSKIDILINNAGLGYDGTLEETTPDQWHQLFDVNVHSVFYCTQQVLPEMKRQGFGHIINISSIAGTVGVPNMIGYSASKHAVRGISHSLFQEVRHYGVKVSCIYPGSVKTHFFDNIESKEASDHMIYPEDIAGTIIHLLEARQNYHHVDVEVRPLMPKGKQK